MTAAFEPSVTARAAGLATSTLANALDACGLHDNVMPSIKAVAPGFRFAGPALTVRERSGEYGTFASEDFRVGAIIDAALAGDVVVIEAGGVPYSTWGGMASLAAKLKGVAGLIVDGGVRDLEEMVEFAFPVFARHVVPTTGRTRLSIDEIGVPVTVDGVRVAPGDLIVADGSGIVSLPAARAAELVALAEEIAAADVEAAEALRRGFSFTEAMARFKQI